MRLPHIPLKSTDERMKALELGYAPSDAEIERAKAYASAAWAAGQIGRSVEPSALLARRRLVDYDDVRLWFRLRR